MSVALLYYYDYKFQVFFWREPFKLIYLFFKSFLFLKSLFPHQRTLDQLWHRQHFTFHALFTSGIIYTMMSYGSQDDGI